MRIFSITSCAAAVSLLLSNVVWASDSPEVPPDYPEKPPEPAEVSWQLLSDNLKETTQPILQTDVTYECEPKARWIADVIGPEALRGEDPDTLEYGRRLLDGYTQSELTDGLVWNFNDQVPPPDVFVTFDLKRVYQIYRVDILLRTNHAANGYTPAQAPAQITYLLSKNDHVAENVEETEGWAEKEPSLEFADDDRPVWVSSKFEPGPAHFVRLRFILKSKWLSVAEVRIWGAPLGSGEENSKAK